MSLEHGHLAPSAASLLTRPDADRIAAIREERWITYPRARLSLELLDDLLDRPRTTRMPSLAIYADSGMGKTMLMERFRRAHPATYDRAERRLISPVLTLQMASHATERRFYGQLLTAIGVPFVPRATVLEMEIQALRNLRRMEVRLLMLDEVHNILAAVFPRRAALLLVAAHRRRVWRRPAAFDGPCRPVGVTSLGDRPCDACGRHAPDRHGAALGPR
jgi:hypothetical protein